MSLHMEKKLSKPEIMLLKIQLIRKNFPYLDKDPPEYILAVSAMFYKMGESILPIDGTKI